MRRQSVSGTHTRIASKRADRTTCDMVRRAFMTRTTAASTTYNRSSSTASRILRRRSSSDGVWMTTIRFGCLNPALNVNVSASSIFLLLHIGK